MKTIQISTDITATMTNRTANLYDAAMTASVNLEKWMFGEELDEDFNKLAILCDQWDAAWNNFVTGGNLK